MSDDPYKAPASAARVSRQSLPKTPSVIATYVWVAITGVGFLMLFASPDYIATGIGLLLIVLSATRKILRWGLAVPRTILGGAIGLYPPNIVSAVVGACIGCAIGLLMEQIGKTKTKPPAGDQ